MPLNNGKTLWFTNLSTAFAGLAFEGCVSKETYTIMDNHIKMMRTEIDEVKKRKKTGGHRGWKCPPSASDDGAGVATVATTSADPVAPYYPWKCFR